jgi:hypothetical protein
MNLCAQQSFNNITICPSQVIPGAIFLKQLLIEDSFGQVVPGHTPVFIQLRHMWQQSRMKKKKTRTVETIADT